MCFLFVPVSYLNRPHLQVQYLSLIACLQERLCSFVYVYSTYSILLFNDAQIESWNDKRERTNLLQSIESCWKDLNAANSVYIRRKVAVLGLYFHNTQNGCSDIDVKPKALRSVTNLFMYANYAAIMSQPAWAHTVCYSCLLIFSLV